MRYIAPDRKECAACNNAPVTMDRAEYLISRLVQTSAAVRTADMTGGMGELDDAAVSFGICKDAIINALLGRDGE